MSFLAPLFLLAAAAIAVPLILHLFQRRDTARMAFPALRYLRRAEREHARTIRLRQILLLTLRLLAILLLVTAGARLYLRSGSASHEPTALAVILDNSLSSGRVRGERRVLDLLKDRAFESLEAGTPDDRVWLILAGEPWQVVTPSSPAVALEKVMGVEPSAAGGDLTGALERARSLVLASGLPAAEIHLLSDLQASAFSQPEGEGPRSDVPVVTLLPSEAPPPNRWLTGVALAEGVAPLAGEATQVVVGVQALPTVPDSFPIRLVIGDRTQGVGLAPPGTRIGIPAGPFSEGIVTGRAEIDPDALRADDRRFFAFHTRRPSRVYAPEPDADPRGTPDFLSQALTVLEDAGRIQMVQNPEEAQLIVSRRGEGLREARSGIPAMVVPPADPTLLPAVNRRLAEAGIPWELRATGDLEGQETGIESGDRVPALSGTRIYRYYTLRRTDRGESPTTQVRLTTGQTWLVAGPSAGGRYLIVASPLEHDATNLPVSAAMIPFMEWVVGPWLGGAGTVNNLTVGERLPAVPGATRVQAPDGTLLSLGGTSVPPEARIPGIYRILRGDSLMDAVAANPPPSESELTPLEPSVLQNAVGPGLVAVSEPSAWSREIFLRREGPELWRPLLITALLVLLLETWLSTGGGGVGKRTEDDAGRDEPEDARKRARV